MECKVSFKWQILFFLVTCVYVCAYGLLFTIAGLPCTRLLTKKPLNITIIIDDDDDHDHIMKKIVVVPAVASFFFRCGWWWWWWSWTWFWCSFPFALTGFVSWMYVMVIVFNSPVIITHYDHKLFFLGISPKDWESKVYKKRRR